MAAEFDDSWDGQVPEVSNHIVMTAQKQGQEKIARRVGTGTGATGPGAKHPGARPTMEEMIVEAKHRSVQRQKRQGTGAKAKQGGTRRRSRGQAKAA